jgi:hypothetical protein
MALVNANHPDRLASPPTWHEVAGNIHMHTVHSDGTGTFADLVVAARANRLNFLMTTDHNQLVAGKEGWYGDLLLLVGQEVHDAHRVPEGNHLLILGGRHDLTAQAADPQALLDAARADGALTFFAHPVERATELVPHQYPWWNWEVSNFTGIELWNFMSEFRGYAHSKAHALLMSHRPDWFSTGPWPEALALWDELLTTRAQPIVAIGGSDAHAHLFTIGPIRRHFLPYRYCFGAVNTHLLLPAPLTGDLAHDRHATYDALRAGHCWVGYDRIGRTAGFRFDASDGTHHAVMGDCVTHSDSPWRFEVTVPDRARVRLLRNGEPVAQADGRTLRFASQLPGVYRVEAWRRYRGKARGWIFSNPIYVE